MINIIIFIKNNLAYIILGSIIFLGLLVLFSISKKNHSNDELGKPVIIERMENAKDNTKDNAKDNTKDNAKEVTLSSKSFDATFCDNHSEPDKLHDQCNKLMKTKDSCNLPHCCVWAGYTNNKEECVGGDKDGPTYHQSDNSSTQLKEYHHRGKHYDLKNKYDNLEDQTSSLEYIK